MKLLQMIAVFLLVAAMFACDARTRTDTTDTNQRSGVGFVRSIDWYHRNIIFETDGGYQKTFSPLCDADAMQVWQGEHCEFGFRWTAGVNYTPEHGMGCYALDWVRHVPPDAK